MDWNQTHQLDEYVDVAFFDYRVKFYMTPTVIMPLDCYYCAL